MISSHYLPPQVLLLPYKQMLMCVVVPANVNLLTRFMFTESLVWP